MDYVADRANSSIDSLPGQACLVAGFGTRLALNEHKVGSLTCSFFEAGLTYCLAELAWRHVGAGSRLNL